MKPLTKTMEAHIKHGIGGMSASTEKALAARGLIQDSAVKPGFWELSERGEEEAFRLRGDAIVSWKAGVLTAGDEAFVFNGLRFATKLEANRYLCDLSWRWTAVKAVRVEPSKEPVNRRVVEGRVEAVPLEPCGNCKGTGVAS